MWYKKGVSHADLYPSLKDPTTGMVIEDNIDGKIVRKVCPEGIEVYQGAPPSRIGVQPFDSDRLDVDSVHETVTKIMDAHPALFDDVSRGWWDEWLRTVPRTHTDAAGMAEVDSASVSWPPKAPTFEPLTVQDLQGEYSEAILYRNTGGTQQHFTHRERTQARMDQLHASDIDKGEILAFVPDPADTTWCTPFWVGEAEESVAQDATDIPTINHACFKNGYACSDVTGAFGPVCIGSEIRGGHPRYHQYSSKCMLRGRPKHGHGPMRSTMPRQAVVLYKLNLTAKQHKIAKKSREELWKLREKLSSHGGVPKTFESK